MVFWFLGFPGSGKSYCARILGTEIEIPVVDGDDFLTDENKERLIKGTFSKKERFEKLDRIIKFTRITLKKNKHVAVVDSLPSNSSRKLVLESFPNNVVFILVEAISEVFRKRIKERKGHFFMEEMLDKWIKDHWEEIREIEYLRLDNSKENDGKLSERILQLLNSYL